MSLEGFYFITCSGRICYPPDTRGPEHAYFVGIERDDANGLPYLEALWACLRTLELEFTSLPPGSVEAKRVRSFIEQLRIQADDPTEANHAPNIANGKIVTLGEVLY